MKDPDLWNRLTGHDFPLDATGKTLFSHLVDQTTLGAWKADIAVEEYRKFLYLAAVSGDRLAPSPLIYRLWQTHIEHTRAYFDDFSPRIIGQVIHHAPGPDPAAPYRATLALYQQEFGQRPFHRVWPSPRRISLSPFGNIFIIAIATFILMVIFDVQWSPLIHVAGAFALLAVFYLFFGYWTVKKKDDGGCSSCGGGGDGGCGGD